MRESAESGAGLDAPPGDWRSRSSGGAYAEGEAVAAGGRPSMASPPDRSTRQSGDDHETRASLSLLQRIRHGPSVGDKHSAARRSARDGVTPVSTRRGRPRRASPRWEKSATTRTRVTLLGRLEVQTATLNLR